MAKLDSSYVTSIAAPTLLDLVRDTGKSSYLRQRVSKTHKPGKEEKWKYCFAVLVNTALYVYDDETSRRPRDCIDLVGYTCVRRVASEKCLFGLAISATSATTLDDEEASNPKPPKPSKPSKPSKPDQYFACCSECDRRCWMVKIKEHLYKSNNIPSPELFFDSLFVEDENEYLAIEVPINTSGERDGDTLKGRVSLKHSTRRNAVTDMNYLTERS